MKEVGVITGGLETKLNSKIAGAASVEQLTKSVQTMQQAIAAVSKKAPSAHWVMLGMTTACRYGAGPNAGKVNNAVLTLVGFGFAPGRKYKLRLQSADGKHSATSTPLVMATNMEHPTHMRFDVPTLIKAWGNAKVTKAAVTLVADIDGKEVVLSYTGVTSGNIATLVSPCFDVLRLAVELTLSYP